MLSIEGVEKRYNDDVPVLRGVSLTLQEGEIVCLLGPSGCGKTTLLRIVTGLEKLDKGHLLLDGADLTAIPVHRRNFGLMFQEFALFPHRTVAENVAFGLRMAGNTKTEITARVQAVLALVGLTEYAHRSIFDLSGGERQRVALARSLAPNPRLLMLDEPLGSLDRTLRDELVTELRTILTRVKATALYVTHDQQEAFAIADRLVVMNAGQIEQIGTPHEVYQHPANVFVARFLGLSNLVPVQPLSPASAQLQTPLGCWTVPPTLLHEIEMGRARQLLIRPDGVQAVYPGANTVLAAGQPGLVGTVTMLSFRGATYRLEVNVEGTEAFGEDGDDRSILVKTNAYHLGFDLPAAFVAPHVQALAVGALVTVQIDPAALTLVG